MSGWSFTKIMGMLACLSGVISCNSKQEKDDTRHSHPQAENIISKDKQLLSFLRSESFYEDIVQTFEEFFDNIDKLHPKIAQDQTLPDTLSDQGKTEQQDATYLANIAAIKGVQKIQKKRLQRLLQIQYDMAFLRKTMITIADNIDQAFQGVPMDRIVIMSMEHSLEYGLKKSEDLVKKISKYEDYLEHHNLAYDEEVKTFLASNRETEIEITHMDRAIEKFEKTLLHRTEKMAIRAQKILMLTKIPLLASTIAIYAEESLTFAKKMVDEGHHKEKAKIQHMEAVIMQIFTTSKLALSELKHDVIMSKHIQFIMNFAQDIEESFRDLEETQWIKKSGKNKYHFLQYATNVEKVHETTKALKNAQEDYEDDGDDGEG